jgi:hypothetical protein
MASISKAAHELTCESMCLLIWVCVWLVRQASAVLQQICIPANVGHDTISNLNTNPFAHQIRVTR